MDVRADLDAACSPGVLFAWVDDLGTYERWLGIVPRTTPAAADPGDPGPAWDVTLRGRLGPLARSKRLRMVRTERVPPAGEGGGHAVFERRELDGRDHATWRLRAQVEPTGSGSRLLMDLHYGGSLWVPLLDRLLQGEIESSRQRLRDLVESGPPSA